MPYKRVKDGKVVEEHSTKQPTAEQAAARKQEKIAEQNKQLAEFENKRNAQDSAPVKEIAKNKTTASE